MTERKLASIVTIDAIDPIEGADNIEVATVKGWKVVVRKGEFEVGQNAVYFEIDSALPLDKPEFEFLRPRGVKEVVHDGQEKEVHVLKTIKLRGQYSQGLLIPVADWEVDVMGVGADVSNLYGVFKYEPPIPAAMKAKAVGNFPTHIIAKTDAERVQNLTKHYASILEHPGGWYATEKVDGMSVTFLFTDNGERPVRLCTRNWEIEPNPDHAAMKALAESGMLGLHTPAGFIIQAELYGEGIQGNPLKINGNKLAVFGVYIYDHELESHAVPVLRALWPESVKKNAAPILDMKLPPTVQECVDQVDGLKSTINHARLAEGVVWHFVDGQRPCFKVINNKYLLKQKD